MELLLLLEGEPGELVGEEQPGPSGELKEFTVNKRLGKPSTPHYTPDHFKKI